MIEMNWFLPTGGDSRDVLPDDSSINRAPSHAYLAQIARACEELGFDALLTPCGTGCEDAWLATSSLIALTSRIKFLVAFRPALLTPTLAAQMASTFQRMSNGRCLVNIVTGAEQAELARFGVTEDKETRYERTGEFIEVMRGAWSPLLSLSYLSSSFSIIIIIFIDIIIIITIIVCPVAIWLKPFCGL
jgi:alkanesulfonate monooxygenase